MQQQIMRGTVTSLDPFRVRIDGLDEDGQPCQRTAPAALNQVGGVDVSGRQRRWVGGYGQDATDLGPLTTRVVNLEDTVLTGSNRNALLRTDLAAVADIVIDGPNRNVLLRSDLTAVAYTVNTGPNRSSLLRFDIGQLENRVSTLESKVAALEAVVHPQIQQGFGSMGISASSTEGTLVGRITVTFPTEFTGSSVPRVMTNLRGSATALDHLALHLESVSNTEFTVRCSLVGASTTAFANVPIDWIAVK